MADAGWSMRAALCAAVLGLALPAGFAQPTLAQAGGFPFESELFLDARPMAGSKRIPNLDVAADGAIVFEMWCNRVEGRFVVAGDTVTALVGPPTDRPCRPEQKQGDADLLAALTAVTNWQRQGDTVVLVGPKVLRFSKPTH